MHRSSPLRSTLNTNVFTGLDMFKVCTEAVHSLSETVFTTSTTFPHFYGTTVIFRLHFRGALFADSTTLPRFCLWHPADSTTLTRAPYQPGAKNNHWTSDDRKGPSIVHSLKLTASLPLNGCKTGRLLCFGFWPIFRGELLLFPKNPDPSRSNRIFFGFQSHPKRIGMDRGTPEFLGHIWILRI